MSLVKSASYIMNTQEVNRHNEAYRSGRPVGSGTAIFGGAGIGAILAGGAAALLAARSGHTDVAGAAIGGGVLGALGGGLTGGITNEVVAGKRFRRDYPKLHEQGRNFKRYGYQEIDEAHERNYREPVDRYASKKGLTPPSILRDTYAPYGAIAGAGVGALVGGGLTNGDDGSVGIGLASLGAQAASDMVEAKARKIEMMAEADSPKLIEHLRNYRRDLNNWYRME